jgi:hypothetical protein
MKGAPSLNQVLWAYKVLGLSPGALPEEIKRAHREQVFIWHPDRPENADRHTFVEEHLRELNIACEILNRFHPETDFVRLYEKACVSMPVPVASYQEPNPLTRLLQAANTYFWLTVATVVLLWFMIGLAWAVIEDPVPPGEESWSRGGYRRPHQDSSVIELLLLRD